MTAAAVFGKLIAQTSRGASNVPELPVSSSNVQHPERIPACVAAFKD